jgi:hypothetical protein
MAFRARDTRSIRRIVNLEALIVVGVLIATCALHLTQ